LKSFKLQQFYPPAGKPDIFYFRVVPGVTVHVWLTNQFHQAHAHILVNGKIVLFNYIVRSGAKFKTPGEAASAVIHSLIGVIQALREPLNLFTK